MWGSVTEYLKVTLESLRTDLFSFSERCLFYRIYEGNEEQEAEDKGVSELRSELWEKEMKLTDIRLEALNSAHQLEQLREAMNNMQVCQHRTNHTLIETISFLLQNRNDTFHRRYHISV